MLVSVSKCVSLKGPVLWLLDLLWLQNTSLSASEDFGGNLQVYRRKFCWFSGPLVFSAGFLVIRLKLISKGLQTVEQVAFLPLGLGFGIWVWDFLDFVDF